MCGKDREVGTGEEGSEEEGFWEGKEIVTGNRCEEARGRGKGPAHSTATHYQDVIIQTIAVMAMPPRSESWSCWRSESLKQYKLCG